MSARRRLAGWFWAGATAAAAVLLVAVFYGRPGPVARVAVPAVRAADAAASNLSLTREAVDAGLNSQYEAYLAGVDDAISEIERALSENPSNSRVRRAYQGAHAAHSRSFDRIAPGGR